MQSYQNVSNSQHFVSTNKQKISCKRLCKVIKMLAIHNRQVHSNHQHCVANAYAKLSKCQQFTTNSNFKDCSKQLQTLMQSYQNVSNSQLKIGYYYTIMCCKRLCKVIKMLAIHNDGAFECPNLQVANAYAKLSKCQQFTTCIRQGVNGVQLQTLLQSYQNVSNSQQT